MPEEKYNYQDNKPPHFDSGGHCTKVNKNHECFLMLSLFEYFQNLPGLG